MSHATLTQEIEDWLIAEALRDADIMRLFEEVCARLKAMGVPLERAVLNWLTLHPLFRSEHAFWFPGQHARLERRYHATVGNDEYLRSPFYHVQQQGLTSLRRRLAGDGAVVDFDVLHDFVGQGFTDYLLTATFFRIADVTAGGEGRAESSGLLASWATKRRGGFADDDLDALQRIQRVLAVACRAAIQQRVMTNLATTYLGPTAGGRVLAGDIRRGDGERITAAIWFSDLRDSTRLSDSMDPDSYLALLNRYFECTAQPVIDQGGEILNFIGDGVFAIFPVDNGDAAAAAARAEA
ncbi:MAG TPA: adenylate/guanylate cyclase domain-containing protein, partial [Thermohalobaculum sp.]|nr:adenylate/guanylate cyclase domain-containing protein [Thermohalobaculum sp.]